MKFQLRFINSKIGRRIYSMFALCALVPIVVLGAISYFQVSEQLQKQSYARMQKEVKSHGLAIYERLIFLESELRLIGLKALNLNEGEIKDDIESTKFRSISTIRINDEAFSIQDSTGMHNRKPSITEKQFMDEGNSVIWGDKNTKAGPLLYMLQKLPGSGAPSKYLKAEISQDYLWGGTGGNAVSPMTDIFILGPSHELFFNSTNDSVPFAAKIMKRITDDSTGAFDLQDQDENYLVVYRLLFTQPMFLFDGFTVVLCQPKSLVLEPMATFRQTFPAIVAATAMVALLLSSIHIRKSLLPLDRLREGIFRITHRKYNQSVVLESGDEFEELATHFNQMTGQLNQQFKALNTRAEIDRTILSSTDTREIIAAAVIGMQGLFQNDSIAISLIHSTDEEKSETYCVYHGHSGVCRLPVLVHLREVEILNRQNHMFYDDTDELPEYLLSIFAGNGNRKFLVLPVLLKQTVVAVIVLARKVSNAYDEEDIRNVGQMADQIAVALSKSQLLEELKFIHWGTLIAFGRAVDAKSPWTAGHSERVAKLAVLIGRRMSLDDQKLDMLERAGILHDIGKIGVPASILDKPGKLNPEEYRIIQKHPSIGARILEPIEVFAPVIPMILQHHEQFGGNGYPNGISGEEIDFCARILSVADVFDALTSHRPYRTAMPLEKVVEIMTDGSGKMFDPSILDVFLDMVRSEEVRRLTDGRSAFPALPLFLERRAAH